MERINKKLFVIIRYTYLENQFVLWEFFHSPNENNCPIKWRFLVGFFGILGMYTSFDLYYIEAMFDLIKTVWQLSDDRFPFEELESPAIRPWYWDPRDRVVFFETSPVQHVTVFTLPIIKRLNFWGVHMLQLGGGLIQIFLNFHP